MNRCFVLKFRPTKVKNDCSDLPRMTKLAIAKKKWLKEELQLLAKQEDGGNLSKYAALLRASCDLKALTHGKQVHAFISRDGFERDILIGNLLISLYGKCGSIPDAVKVFDEMVVRDVISWTTMITAYSDNGRSHEALLLFENMQNQNVKPNKITLLSALNACHSPTAISMGKYLHALIFGNGFLPDVTISTALVSMYGRCGDLLEAVKVFKNMHDRDIVSYNAMTVAYAQNGNVKAAVQILEQMKHDVKIKPNRSTYVGILSGCASPSDLTEGRLIHYYIVKDGFESDVVLGTAVVTMYGRCGSLRSAREVFDNMPERNVVSWNAMITAYNQHRQGQTALEIFELMQQNALRPDKVTLLNILEACGIQESLIDGRKIHASIKHIGLESDIAINNSLVDMYGKCGSVEEACEVFSRMPKRNVVSWNAMMASYAHCGNGKEVLQLFGQMQLLGFQSNKITIVSLLDACAALEALAEGEVLHHHIVDAGYDSDMIVKTALINLYGKCGALETAREIFDGMAVRDLVSWTAIISAYAQNGNGMAALKLFEEMQREGIMPDKVTLVSILDACASLAALVEGKSVHTHIVDSGYGSDLILGNALLNMYCRCGSLIEARIVFDKMPERDLVTCNAVISGYAQQGLGFEALEIFNWMQLEGFDPDNITFINVIFACSHAGLVDKGCEYFGELTLHHGFVPEVEHYGCMIDLLGRAGRLEEAEDLLNNSHCKLDAVVWMALLSACRVHEDVDRGKRVAEVLFDMDPHNAAPYVVLSNIYAASGKWAEVKRLRKVMGDKYIKKLPGSTLIEATDCRLGVFDCLQMQANTN